MFKTSQLFEIGLYDEDFQLHEERELQKIECVKRTNPNYGRFVAMLRILFDQGNIRVH